MEIITLLTFVIVLIVFIIMQFPLIYALIIGYGIFCAYALHKKHTLRQILRMSYTGIHTIHNLLIVFILIGMLTALWRAAGTIPVIVCSAAELIHPSIFLLMTFLLNCLLSFLTGTSMGTTATMGAICMTIGLTMHINPVFVGGAIISGAFFGDRCSPVSTSALLVAELTATDIFKNVINMLRTAVVPFVATCLIYFVLGWVISPVSVQIADMQALFAEELRLGWIPLIPALIILLLSLFRVNVKLTTFASVISAGIICLAYQHMSFQQLLTLLLSGYSASNPEIAVMMNGGGIISMLTVVAIVCISSSYAGLFQGTGLLDQIKERAMKLSGRTSRYCAILITSLVSSMVSCNQTLAIMLTHQICGSIEKDNRQLALDLENTAVIISPLIPWSIAGAVPLAIISAPTASLALACYLYLIPLWRLFMQNRRHQK